MTVEDTVPVFMILGTIRKQLTACHYTDKTQDQEASDQPNHLTFQALHSGSKPPVPLPPAPASLVSQQESLLQGGCSIIPIPTTGPCKLPVPPCPQTFDPHPATSVEF